jgi:predicted metal-dependent hydrolase
LAFPETRKNMIEQQLCYGDKKIPYKILFSPKQHSKLAIHIYPNGQVTVNSPQNTSLSDIKTAVYKRANWIDKHINNIGDQNYFVLPREYISGESHFYIGRRYLLKLKKGSTSVKLTRGQIQINTNKNNSEDVKALLRDWYIEHAECFFQKRLTEICSEMRWIKQVPEWKLRVMKKQWGSCSPKGVLSLNPHLIKAPRQCIDYVIIHELCHLKIHNHSNAYYKLLTKTLPEWEATKNRLDGMAELILNN